MGHDQTNELGQTIIVMSGTVNGSVGLLPHEHDIQTASYDT